MESIFNSPRLQAELSIGKYSRWAERLNADTLQATLLAVGEFGVRYSSMRSPDGTFPAPTFRNCMGAEFRMVLALEDLAAIYAERRPKNYLGPCGGFSLSTIKPAFSKEFNTRLSQNPLTAWAQALDENNLALLLWNVGEYCCRVGRCPPTFGNPQDPVRRMRAALKYLERIYLKAGR